MNYKKIYDQLIADRRLNPPSEAEYVEVHHILPRCMGGTDEPENLIRLRPEDHFFAHLLLAKTYDTRQLWGALIAMHARKPRSELLYKRTRVKYGFVRRRYGELCSEFRVGEDNPNFNPEKITLKHKNGSVVSATRLEWNVEYGVPHANLCGVLSGGRKSCLGWMLPRTKVEKTGVLSGLNNPASDKVIRMWRHVDGRIVIADKYKLARQQGLRINDLSGVISGRHGHHRGWYLDQSKIGWKNKPNRVLGRDDAVYTLIHVGGSNSSGNRRELSASTGVNQRGISDLLMGRRKSERGWMTVGVYNSGYTPRGFVPANDNQLQLALVA